jgi:hypothetical protein
MNCAKLRAIAAVAGWCVCWAIMAPALEAAPAAPACRLRAQVTPDNDIRLNDDRRPRGKLVAVPSAVQAKIFTIAAGLLTQMQLTPQWFKCTELYPAQFRISLPAGLYLYVVDISVGSGVEYFLLILHDPKTGAVTGSPPLIHATSTQEFGWKDPLLAKPLVSFADLFGNRHTIVIEERVHNGTVYNAVVYNYFEIGPGLALTRVLAVEKRALAVGPREGAITRDLKLLGQGQLRLDTSLQPANQPGQRQPLGYAILQSQGAGFPFQVKERHARDKDSNAILVTYCGPDTPGDDAFLRDGYTFHY